MDTSDVEVINPPPLETQDEEINLETSTNCEDHQVVPDDQNQNPVEDSTIVEQFDNLEIQSNDEDEEEGEPQNYPSRPNATDCAFFIRTGTCKYGLNCRFNHPPKRVFKAVGEKSTEELNGMVCDNPKKIECKYFSTPGGCKYRDACRYDHPSEEIEMTDPKLNFLGLPMRPMEKECTFYMRTGSCGYGANCRFDHPDPMPANDPEPGNSLANGYSVKVDNNFPKPSGPMHFSGVSNGVNSRNFTPYASDMNSYQQGMPRNPEWNQNQVSIPHQTADLSKKQDPSANYKHLMQSEEFPERAGQPDCDYFMRTGDCKYKSACRFNHPRSRSSRPPQPTLSSKGLYSRSEQVSPVETTDFHNSYSGNARKNGMSFDNNNQKMYNGGYPERPGQAECEYYMKTGSCKFNSDCRYHHPRNRVSASSYTLSEKGLPLRPGAKICRNYENQGTCQYGTRCLFNHPDIVSPSDQAVVEDNYNHPTTNLEVPSLESQVSINAESNWNDGWEM